MTRKEIKVNGSKTLYARTQEYTTTERYSLRRAIEVLKAEISIEDYLHDHSVEVRCNRARCVVHGGDNPTSFSINPEKQLWYCFSCGEGGDLIDLVEAVEKHADTWTAVVSLAMRYSVALPEKPKKWREWVDEKAMRREMVRRIRTRHYQRRLLRLFKEELDGIEDGAERREETRRIYADLYYLALRCALQREAA